MLAIIGLAANFRGSTLIIYGSMFLNPYVAGWFRDNNLRTYISRSQALLGNAVLKALAFRYKAS